MKFPSRVCYKSALLTINCLAVKWYMIANLLSDSSNVANLLSDSFFNSSIINWFSIGVK